MVSSLSRRITEDEAQPTLLNVDTAPHQVQGGEMIPFLFAFSTVALIVAGNLTLLRTLIDRDLDEVGRVTGFAAFLYICLLIFLLWVGGDAYTFQLNNEVAEVEK